MSLQTFQLNRRDVVSGNNSTLSRESPIVIPRGTKVALQKINVSNSFPNIQRSITFYYTFPGDSTNYPVVIPGNTNVSISDINGILTSVMTTNGHYLIDATGNKVFYLSLTSAPIYYSLAFTFTGAPSTLPSGYSAPVGWSYPAVNGTVFKVVISDPALVSLLGFPAGTYPSVATGDQRIIPSGVPNFNPYGTVYIATNLVNNLYNAPSNIIGSFQINTAYGSEISYEPNVMLFTGCEPVKTIEVRLCAEDGSTIPMIEKGFSCSFVFQLP